MMKEWFSDLSKLLFPKVCVLCQSDLISEENHLCSLCLADLPETNFQHHTQNSLEQKLLGRFEFEHVNALYYFNTESKIQDLLHEVKYKGNHQLARHLGHLLGLKLRQNLPVTDYIIPVPLHQKRIAVRGYNQAALMAEGLSECVGIAVEQEAVLRIKNTDSQTRKNSAERMENMQGAFKWQHEIKNKRILLLDDVITTGSTLQSLVLAMPPAWNNKISILSFAAAVDA